MSAVSARPPKRFASQNFTICPQCSAKMPDDSFGTPPNYCPSCGMRTGAELPMDEDVREVDFERRENLEGLRLNEDYVND